MKLIIFWTLLALIGIPACIVSVYNVICYPPHNGHLIAAVLFYLFSIYCMVRNITYAVSNYNSEKRLERLKKKIVNEIANKYGKQIITPGNLNETTAAELESELGNAKNEG